MLDELVRRDADEARRESALRHERGRCALGNRTHCRGDRDVLRKVEVMQAFRASHFGDGDVAEIGQARYERDRLVRAYVPRECFLVARIEVERGDRIESMRRGNRFRDAGLGICELYTIAAAFSQQAGYEGTDLAGAEYEDLFHGGS